MIGLQTLVEDFATGVRLADKKAPVSTSQRSKRTFRSGIGPHSEEQTIEMTMIELAAWQPSLYGQYGLGIPYPNGSGQECDLGLGIPSAWEWVIEVKMIRFLGDNGKQNDNMMGHVLSPYPQDRSALTDCEKLKHSDFKSRKAVVIYGYDHDGLTLEPAIAAFETLARRRVELDQRCASAFEGLIHPVHQQGWIFGWQLN